MIKYFHIIKFLMTHDLTFLKECWQVEFIKNKKFTWIRVINRALRDDQKFLFWWRLCSEMALHGNKSQKRVAGKINSKLKVKYNIDIGICKTFIDVGFNIGHYSSIVIFDNIKAGKNFSIRQNTTIGSDKSFPYFEIGDNVLLGANVCILGGNIKIGNNVTIGAMTFINKDIPDNCTVYTEKTNKIIYKAH